MPINRTYECPECEGQFSFLHMTRDEPPPAHCPLCHAFVGEVEPQLPRINIGGSNIAKSVDAVQQSLELTNPNQQLQDRLRPGDVAAKPVSNIITQVAENSGHNFWQGNAGSAATAELISLGRGDKSAAGVLGAIQESRMGLR